MRRFTFKLVLLGGEAVGKTSLVLRFVNNTFNEKYISTIGADFLVKDLELLGAPVRLMLWDIAGGFQIRWEGIRSKYMAGADGCILVFDVSRKNNFEGYITQWLGEIHDFIGDPPVIIVGNKVDLPHQVDLKKVAKFVQNLNHFFIETSAKTGTRVEAMFQKIAAEIVKRKAKKLTEVKRIKEEEIAEEKKLGETEEDKKRIKKEGNISELFQKMRERE